MPPSNDKPPILNSKDKLFNIITVFRNSNQRLICKNTENHFKKHDFNEPLEKLLPITLIRKYKDESVGDALP